MLNKRSRIKVTAKPCTLKTESNKDKPNKRRNDSTFKEYMDASQASATKRAYASDLRHFLAHGGSVPCTPKRLAKYLAESANNGLAVATLERRITAIHKVLISTQN